MFKIKCLVCYHERSFLLKDDILTPINPGRDIAKPKDLEWLKKYTIGDNSGDNISIKNKRYNEMTAIYWAWKNQDKLGNPDSIGVMHYRHHLVLDEKVNESPDSWTVNFPGFQNGLSSYYKKIGYSEEKLRRLSETYPCIVGYADTNITVFDQYKVEELEQAHHIEDLNFVVSYIREHYPDFSSAVDLYLKGKRQYLYNIFILHKSIFDRYCRFTFDVLQAFDSYLQSGVDRSEWEKRFFVSERITGIFITKLIEEQVKTKFLKISFVQEPHEYLAPEPIANSVNIAFATDENYLPNLFVALTSLAEHTSKIENYSIYILHSSISNDVITKFLSELSLPDNIKTEFVNISPLWNNLDITKFKVGAHIRLATYYRFLIQKAFPKFQRMLYLDSDIIVLDDVAKLYKTPIGNKPLAAALDIRENFASKKKVVECGSKKRVWPDYLENELKIDALGMYFQAGVMIFDLVNMGKFDLLNRCLKKLEEIPDPWLYDQCIMNAEFANEVAYIDVCWNVEWQIPFEFPNYKKELPEFLANQYFLAIKKPKIIHYASPVKPWKNIDLPLSEIWWQYARKSPYYEKFLYNALTSKHKENISIIEALKRLLKRKYIFHKKEKII